MTPYDAYQARGFVLVLEHDNDEVWLDVGVDAVISHRTRLERRDIDCPELGARIRVWVPAGTRLAPIAADIRRHWLACVAEFAAAGRN